MPASWEMEWALAAWTVGSAFSIYVLLVIFSRLIGPRAFSQMTAFDFAVTVALGAIVGSTAAGAVGLPVGLLGLAALFVFRAVVASLRRHGLDRFVDNRPILLMRDGRFVDDNLRLAKVTRDDVHEGLRLAGIASIEQVGAVIIERNGELSVLRGAHADLDPQLMQNVVGTEPLTTRTQQSEQHEH